MSTTYQQKANILRYWESIEYFTPQALPDLAPRHEAFPVYRVSPVGPMPWMQGHAHQRRQLRPYYAWRYTAFLNPVSLKAIRDSLEALLGTSESATARDERSDQASALFAVAIDRHGLFVPDTLVCASIGWAYTALIQGQGQQAFSFEDFQQYEEDARYMFDERYAGKYASTAVLEQLSKDLLNGIILPESAQLPRGYRVSAFSFKLDQEELAQEQARQQRGAGDVKMDVEDEQPDVPPEPPPNDMLNSFFLGELSEIANHVSRGNSSPPLDAYLGDNPTDQRDVRKPISLSWNALNPTRFPTARWPGKGRFPLVYSQQVAVNLMLYQLAKGSGLQAVNGPPGTGKTTLLKDVVAAIITQRAEALSAFSRPEEAFGVKNTAFRAEKFTQYYHKLDPSLAGFGMVVASANNGAVENVVEEFPAAEDVDPQRGKRESVFTDLASELLGREAWSLLSVKLGNKSNRNAFLSAFWFNAQRPKPSGVEDVLPEPPPKAQARIKNSKLTKRDWSQSVAKFKQALADEQALRKEREFIHNGILRQRKLEAHIKELEQAANEAELQLDIARQAFHSIQQEHTAALNSFTAAEAKFKMLKYQKPHWFWLMLHSLIPQARVKNWLANQEETIAGYESSRMAQESAKTLYIERNESFKNAVNRVSQAQQHWESEKKVHRSLVATLARYQRNFPSSFPDTTRLVNDIAYRETCAPLADDAWEEARTRVFICALDLQETFILVTREQSLKNLNLAMNLISGKAPKDISREAVVAAWDTFFMLIPLVSSTFASFHRLFASLGNQDLGWLLIDEAGQAAPHQAVPALWRARRAGIVGDPLQLEPIVSAPFTLQETLRQPFGVAAPWAPSKGSAQTLADAASRFGSYIGDLWVGAPLLVHRRCDEPMFSMCNAIAYNSAMVHGKPPNALDGPLRSEWRHVSGSEASEHWISEEGIALDALLAELAKLGIQPMDIFLISPFRSVVQQLKQRASGQFQGMQAGTIHTVQGKEAKVVILVLGGNPTSHGAKQWASEAPNLLNVAASRSKQLLYIIGNREEWSKYPYFEEASAALA